jgi:NADH dehydrogenase
VVTASRSQVVVVGGGFAGLAAVRTLARRHSPVHVTLIDRHNYHTSPPVLYQVATGERPPSGAVGPLRGLVPPGVEFRLGEVTALDLFRRLVETDKGLVAYDYLILAAGATDDCSARPDVACRALGLGSVGEAVVLRNHILGCFEAAAWTNDPVQRARLLTIVVVGGGATGVELSAALGGLVVQMAGREHPGVTPSECRVVMVEARPWPLAGFPTPWRQAAAEGLRDKGVEVELGATASTVDGRGVVLEDGRRIDAATVVWAGGVRANPLADTLPVTGSLRRTIVNATLQLERHPEVFVVGDMAEMPGPSGPLPMLASVAAQSGRHAGRSILEMCAGRQPTPFHYRDVGVAVVLGRGDAVARMFGVDLRGWGGWLAWLGLQTVPAVGLRAGGSLVAGRHASLVLGRRPARVIVSPDAGRRQPAPPVLGPEPATARVPMARAKVDLPSVNVANANRWGRRAALAWWAQDYPGLRQEPQKGHGIKAMRQREEKLRHELWGDKSQTEDNYRG